MKMKKILISILAFSLTASLFSGCAGQTPVETNSIAVSDTSSTVSSKTSASTEAEQTAESEAVTSSAETTGVSAEDNPATEETAGIDEEALREEGKYWYNVYKDSVTCNEETFITEYVGYRIGGMTDVEASTEVYTLYMKIALKEPTKPVQTETKQSDGSAVEDKVVIKDDDVADAVTGNGDKAEDAKPVKAETTPVKEETPVKDYSNIKWGDPIPDNLTNNYGKKAEVAKWKDAKGGKFVYINGNYYYSIQDWVDGKPGLSMEVVTGITVEDAIDSGLMPEYADWH